MDAVHVDWRVLAFTAALALATGLAFGLAPAFRAARTDVAGSMKSGGRSGGAPVPHRLRNGLVIGEIAFAVLLVTAAGLLVRSFWALTHVDTGFRSERVITARLSPSPGLCAPEPRCRVAGCRKRCASSIGSGWTAPIGPLRISSASRFSNC